jgi:hypothetical protein
MPVPGGFVIIYPGPEGYPAEKELRLGAIDEVFAYPP